MLASAVHGVSSLLSDAYHRTVATPRLVEGQLSAVLECEATQHSSIDEYESEVHTCNGNLADAPLPMRLLLCSQNPITH